MANITSPINTSIQFPLPASQLVSPVSMNSPGGHGSPPLVSAIDTNQMFWAAGNTPTSDRKQVFWAQGGSSAAAAAADIGVATSTNQNTTPVAEKRYGFWSPVSSPAKEKKMQELWSAPKVPASSKIMTKSTAPERKSSLLAPKASSSHQQQKQQQQQQQKHKLKGHNVSFSDSSWDSDRSKGMMSSSQDAESSQSDHSRPNSPYRSGQTLKQMTMAMNASSANEDPALQETRARVIEFVDKRNVALAREVSPPPAPREPPFVAYTETFLQILGQRPRIDQILHDHRAPFFGGSGSFHRPTSTLFVTSALIKDPSPGSVSSRNWNTITTSVTFYEGDDLTRDKVRFGENYMPGGSCVWHPATMPSRSQTFNTDKRSQSSATTGSQSLASSLVLCARGTLGTPSGLLQVAPRRPHTVTPLLTQHPGGKAFNSPHSVVALSDGSLLFTDPPVGYEIGYRPRPQLPPLVHRFDPATGDVRAVVEGLSRPTCIAVSPDERTVYIVDAPRARRTPGKGSYYEDVLDACCAPQPTIQAYSLVGVTQGIGIGGTGVFLTNKRLFAFPGLQPGQEPTGLAVNSRGDVFVACGTAGVLVFSKDGSLVGKIRVDGSEGEGVSGVCCGRRGEMFAWGGGKVWRILCDTSRMA